MIITVKTVYSERDLIKIVQQHYSKPFDLSLISLGDIQQFAEKYTALLIRENGSGPSVGWLARRLVHRLINGILDEDLPDPPVDSVAEWVATDW